MKEELEQEQEHVDSRFAAYGNVHFYVMFNTHLLDREELEKILGKIRREIEDLKKAVEDKDADLETYRSYRSVVENQTFSTALCQQTEKEINRLKDERTAVKGRLGRDLSGAEQAGRGEKRDRNACGYGKGTDRRLKENGRTV